MATTTKIERDFFAMKGALQAIRNAKPDQSAADLREIARATLDFIGSRKCAVCLTETDRTGDPVFCSDECRQMYEMWDRAIERGR